MEDGVKLCACGCETPVKKARFPSTKQARFLQGHQHKGSNNGNYRGGKIKMACPICNVAFFEFPAHADRRVTCGKAHCYAKWQSLTTAARGRNKVTTTCLNCGAEIERWPSQINGPTFCDMACANGFAGRRNETNNGRWRGGKWKFIREKVRIRDAGRCVICGFSMAIDVHHITPKSEGGADTMENGITLCPNHHRLAHSGLISLESYRRGEDPTQPHGLANR